MPARSKRPTDRPSVRPTERLFANSKLPRHTEWDRIDDFFSFSVVFICVLFHLFIGFFSLSRYFIFALHTLNAPLYIIFLNLLVVRRAGFAVQSASCDCGVFIASYFHFFSSFHSLRLSLLYFIFKIIRMRERWWILPWGFRCSHASQCIRKRCGWCAVSPHRCSSVLCGTQKRTKLFILYFVQIIFPK